MLRCAETRLVRLHIFFVRPGDVLQTGWLCMRLYRLSEVALALPGCTCFLSPLLTESLMHVVGRTEQACK
jgi:hypothetical protein